MLLWAKLVYSLASPWCCSQVPGDWRSRKLLEWGLELQYVVMAKVAPRCQIEIHWCKPTFTNAPHQFSHYWAIQSVEAPNFRTPNTLLELSAMRRLARAQEPDEKSVWSTTTHHPSIHGGVLVGAGSLWQSESVFFTPTICRFFYYQNGKIWTFFLGRPNVNSASFYMFLEKIIIFFN